MNGAVGFSHPAGTHDNVFWRVALAVYAHLICDPTLLLKEPPKHKYFSSKRVLLPPTTDPQPATTNMKNSLNNQTKPEKQSKHKSNLKTQPSRKFAHTRAIKNNQMEQREFTLGNYL